MYKLLLITLIGYLSGATGLFIGTIMTLAIGALGSRLQKMFMGFAGGMLVSFVCFQMLENAFNIAGVYVSVIGVAAGVLFSVFSEGRINMYSKTANNVNPSQRESKHHHAKSNSAKYWQISHYKHKNKYYRAAVVMCFAIIIHSLMEGVAVGSFLQHSLKSGIALAIILAIHCIPEGVALAAYLKRGEVSEHKIILMSLILAISMGTGSFLGSLLNDLSPKIVSLCLSCAGGVMLYVACGQIIPETKGRFKNLLTYIFAIIGFATALFIIKFL